MRAPEALLLTDVLCMHGELSNVSLLKMDTKWSTVLRMQASAHPLKQKTCILKRKPQGNTRLAWQSRTCIHFIKFQDERYL